MEQRLTLRVAPPRSIFVTDGRWPSLDYFVGLALVRGRHHGCLLWWRRQWRWLVMVLLLEIENRKRAYEHHELDAHGHEKVYLGGEVPKQDAE